MKVGCIPVATGGLYNHVGLIDKEPKVSKYKNLVGNGIHPAGKQK